ncbi:methylmalonyl-CoA carboxyltransferase, partial [Pseudonocardia nematodicida]
MSAATEPMATPDDGSVEPDLHTTAGKLADLYQRFDEAVHAGSEAAVERQHAKGRQTARERLD